MLQCFDVFNMLASFNVFNMLASFNVFALILIVWGVVLCFFGYKIIKFVIAVNGFVLGGALGLLLSAKFSSGVILLFISITLAILFALISFKVYKIGIFLSYGTLAALPIIIINSVTNPNLITIKAVIIFILAGALAVFFIRPVSIILSTITGSVLVFVSLWNLVPSFIGILSFIVLLTTGIIYQFKSTKNMPKKGLNKEKQSEKVVKNGDGNSINVTHKKCNVCQNLCDVNLKFCPKCGTAFNVKNLDASKDDSETVIFE